MGKEKRNKRLLMDVMEVTETDGSGGIEVRINREMTEDQQIELGRAVGEALAQQADLSGVVPVLFIAAFAKMRGIDGRQIERFSAKLMHFLAEFIVTELGGDEAPTRDSHRGCGMLTVLGEKTKNKPLT